VKKTYKVNITRHAQRDLEHIYFYIAEDSIRNARNFILELEEKIYSLETLPECHALIVENDFFGTDYRHFVHKGYRIIYRIQSADISILRIIHGRKLLED
jgi:toxin ParE1/3/4